MAITSLIKMPYKRTYKKKNPRRTFGKRRKRKTRAPMMKRRRKYKEPDSGTYLKLTTFSTPLLINNTTTPEAGTGTTPDTYQLKCVFDLLGSQEDNFIMDNTASQADNSPGRTATFALGGQHSAYAALYKYYQVYKIVVKFWPTITEGGTLTSGTDQTTGQFINAISGTVVTDVARDIETYSDEYSFSQLSGLAKAQSRKVARTHNILKPWTRTFVPTIPVEFPTGNPKAEFQYKPKRSTENTLLGSQNFIIRMKKPTIAGFTAATAEGVEVDFPAEDTFVRFGTIQATAYVKYIQPFN